MLIAYLVSRYPTVSHTFISGEIDAVRERGVGVVTFSARRPRADELLTDLDRSRAAATRTIQPPAVGELLRAHLAAFTRRPSRYFGTLALAQTLSPPGLRMRLWHLFYFAEAILMWRWVRQAGATHIHVHFANAGSMIALLYGHFGEPEGATWSFTMHGPAEFDEVETFRLKDKVARARFVVCISHFARSQLMKVSEPEHWDRLKLVRCGVDTDTWTPRTPPAEQEALRILSVARLVPDKGVGVLLDAVAELSRRGQAAEVDVVGDGPERQALERHAQRVGIADRVRFRGAVGQDRIRDYYGAADVFCLPSFAEGVPIVLMEAMALELPVIATRVMGIPELVEEGRSGLLVDPGDPGALADALVFASEHPGALAEMGRAGRKQVLDRYDVRQTGSALADLFARVG